MPLTYDSITNKQIVETFHEAANDIAEMISKLSDHVGHFEAIEQITRDNGDPSYQGHNAIEALGNLLSSCVIYENEYTKDPYNNPNLNNNSN